MTPTETATILRQFNKWLRGNKDDPQLESREINQAINAAIEMIERLEAAEKERDALRAKIEAMEKRLRLILEEPENTMSNSKALREMVRQARLALEESK